ncbi:MAG: hypothetical protein Q4A67_07405 [Aerococcus sp.]|nr:hypothetical protein [Aerococcus sp.]
MITNNLTEALQFILDSHTGYEIAKKINKTPAQINRLKRGERKLDNASLNLIQAILTAYAKEITIKL